VLPCAEGTPESMCTRRYEVVIPLDKALGERAERGAEVVQLAYALPHLHEGGLSITMMVRRPPHHLLCYVI
jgi:hypothetical protein